MQRFAARGVERGVSLLEVLIAVLVFAIGLLGTALMMIMATRSNQMAFTRSQLAFLVDGMADRMRANPVGVWRGYYDSDHYPVTGSPPACDARAGCGPADVARRDQIVWSGLLAAFLPGLGSSMIRCDASGAGFDASPLVHLRPPYAGTCAVTVTWAERGFAGKDDQARPGNLQSFTWVLQP